MISKGNLHFAAKDLLKKIGKDKTSREYCNQEIVFRQGDTADAMFYIQDGNVKVTVTSRRGKRAALAILRQGDFFGESCLVRRSLRMSTATAIHRSTIARVKKKP